MAHQMRSKFVSKCRKCLQVIEVGQQIVWVKDRGAMHVDCDNPNANELVHFSEAVTIDCENYVKAGLGAAKMNKGRKYTCECGESFNRITDLLDHRERVGHEPEHDNEDIIWDEEDDFLELGMINKFDLKGSIRCWNK